MQHIAQWGGVNTLNEDLVQPNSWTDYLRIFIGASGDENALQTDQNNALGNHLGNFELMVSFDFGKFGFQINLKEKSLIDGLLFEALNTTDQDALRQIDDGVGGEYLEPDSFFNNGVYQSGWTYKGRVVGSPSFLEVSTRQE